jgi:fatty-acyl-CoA synthase
VIGIPDEKWGEAVHAFVVAGGLGEAGVVTHAKSRIGSVKAPKSVEFVDIIPKTPNGKIDKKPLRARYWGENARMVN